MTIAGFTPADARMILDTARWIRATGIDIMAGKKLGQDASVDQVSPSLRFRNDSGETCPAYACMEITGVASIGGRPYFTIDKPASDYGGPYAFNMHRDVADEGFGVGMTGVQVIALCDAPSADAGTRFSAQADSWELIENVFGPYMHAGAEADLGDDVSRFLLQDSAPRIKVMTTPSGGIPAKAAGVYGKATCTMRILTADGSGNVSPSNQSDSTPAVIEVVVHNMGTQVIPGSVDIQVMYIDGKIVANWEDCA